MAAMKHSTNYCDCCGDRGPQGTCFVCSGCLEAKYCSKECQKLNWPDHKGLCLQIKAEREEKERRKQLGEDLVYASLLGHLPEIRRLLGLGADARYKWEEGENKGFFPLYAASQQGCIDVIEALVAGGADPNQVGGKSSCSSLYLAAEFNKPLAIAALVRAGADVNLSNCNGATPLSHAAVNGHREAVIALLVARAAVNHANKKGVSPLYYSAQFGRVEILKLLINAKGDVNQCEKVWGFSPLMAASQQGFVEGVELLLLNGCDVHLKDKYGRTALDLAIINKQLGVEAVLRAHLEVNAEAELLLLLL